jgi:nucleoside-diphosphate-sugar epimerase
MILVFGGTGFIGRHVLAHLAARHLPLGATHLPAEAPPAISGVTWIPCDLTASDAADRWPPRCETVIFLAQSAQWRSFPAGALDVFRVNIAAAVRAIEYACRADAQRFIFASTGSVYTQRRQPTREDEPFALNTPREFYVASKLAAEVLLGPYARLLNVIILRLFMPYGPGQSHTMLIPQLVRRVREGRPIDLQGVDGLRANPVAVADVAETLERCLSLPASATLNLAGPETLSLRQMGECIGRVLGQAPRFQTHPDQEPPVLVGDTTLLRAALGWAPATDFESGLRRWLEQEPKS